MLVVLSLVPLFLVIAIVWPVCAIMKQREELVLVSGRVVVVPTRRLASCARAVA